MRLSYLLLLLVFFSLNVQAKEFQGETSSFGIGISAGSITGTGIDVIKYIGDYFVHGSAMFIYNADQDSFSDFAFTTGRYLNKEEILSFGLPVGFKVLGGVNLTDDNKLRKAVGFGIDLFSPGTKGVSVWYAVTYGTEKYVDEFTFYNSTGIIYNF